MTSQRVDTNVEAQPFALRDCALITIATGRKAQNLRELHAELGQVPASSIYHHFWERLLRAQFDEPEYNNDFASWAYHALHDKTLAERLSVISPTDFADLEGLRQELLDLIEERLDEKEAASWVQAEQHFYFQRGQMVIFDSGQSFTTPTDLIPYLDSLSNGAIYYHFIDARSRTAQRSNDFSIWLSDFGDAYRELAVSLNSLDPYFSSLKGIRQQVVRIFSAYFKGERHE